MHNTTECKGGGVGGGEGARKAGGQQHRGLTCCDHPKHCSLGLIECSACIDADAVGELELQDALRWIIIVVFTCRHFGQGG